MEETQFVDVQGQSFTIIRPDGGLVHSVRAGPGAGLLTKDHGGSTVQLVLDSGDTRQVNILEYLKSEILDTGDKKTISQEPVYSDKDIALKIEVLEDGVKSSVIQPEQLDKLTNTAKKKRRKPKLKIFRPKNYMCGECGTGFVSSKDLNRHRVVHTGEKPYSCPYCDQKFTAPSSRATHIRSIHEKTQEYVCPQCDKAFNQKSNMIKHYKTIHLETIVIVCQECGREFNQASALRRHIKIVHKKELPHMCHCGKKFALAESLKKHMEAIHLKSRAYPCTYCDYAASRADMLKIHVRKIHTKEWSYKCNICEEKGQEWGCILPKELRRHLQTRHPQEYQEQVLTGEEARFPDKRSKADRDPETIHTSLVKLETKAAKVEAVPESIMPEVDVDERALQLLNGIKQPLQFSAQLEAEVRARACRAPPSVLAGPGSGGVVPFKDCVQLDLGTKSVVVEGVYPAPGPGVATLYRQVGGGAAGGAERWQVVASDAVETDTEPGTVLLARGDTHQPLRLFYDYQRN